eukprot:g41087.t1
MSKLCTHHTERITSARTQVCDQKLMGKKCGLANETLGPLIIIRVTCDLQGHGMESFLLRSLLYDAA